MAESFQKWAISRLLVGATQKEWLYPDNKWGDGFEGRTTFHHARGRADAHIAVWSKRRDSAGPTYKVVRITVTRKESQRA